MFLDVFSPSQVTHFTATSSWLQALYFLLRKIFAKLPGLGISAGLASSPRSQQKLLQGGTLW